LRFHHRDRIVVAHQPAAAWSTTPWTSSPATSVPRYDVLTSDVAQHQV